MKQPKSDCMQWLGICNRTDLMDDEWVFITKETLEWCTCIRKQTWYRLVELLNQKKFDDAYELLKQNDAEWINFNI